MATQEQPQIYLITPPEFELASFSEELAALLDRFEIACVRLRMASEDASDVARAADLLREICHQREVPLVIDRHFRLVETHGLDGVHLPDTTANIRDIRKDLGKDAVIGCFAGNSRHAGLNAGESGADYVSFGPLSETPLGEGTPAAFETFEWWSEMIELPVVAEGAITLDQAEKLAPVTDFLALGNELWGDTRGAKAALAEYLERIS